MKLISKERLRSFVGPEPSKKMSARRLARCIQKHHSFIDHLLAGRKTTCEPRTAHRIAEALEVPLEILFDPSIPSAKKETVKQKLAA